MSQQGDRSSSRPQSSTRRGDDGLYRRVGDGSSATTSFARILNDPSFSDVTFVVGDKEYCAHRCILAGRSEAFRAMLFGDSCEAREKKVVVEHVDPHHFFTILEWAYTGTATMSALEVLGVMKLAGFYLFPDLEEHCRRLACNFLDVPNALSLLDSAIENGEEDMISKCLEFLRVRISDSIMTPSWLLLCSTGVKDILSQPVLDVNERTLFTRTMDWISHHAKDEGHRASLMMLFLPHIRFSQLSVNDLLNDVKPVVNAIDVHKAEYVEALEYKLCPQHFRSARTTDRLCPRIPSICQRIANNVPVTFLDGWILLIQQEANLPLPEEVLRKIDVFSTTYICVGEMNHGADTISVLAVGNVEAVLRRGGMQSSAFFQDGSVYWFNTVIKDVTYMTNIAASRPTLKR